MSDKDKKEVKEVQVKAGSAYVRPTNVIPPPPKTKDEK
jgi:hypothetical protein